MAKTWAGIIRVSDMGKRKPGDETTHTDRDQIEAVASAVPLGDGLDMLPPEFNVSGKLGIAERPSLRAAVQGVESGRYAGIICAYHSRLMRNVEHEEEVWRRVEAAGGKIILAQDGLDTSTASGQMVRRIRSAINHAERAEHVVRFDRLRKWATDAGIWQTSVIPYGYAKDPQTRRLVIDVQAAARVRVAFQMKARGSSLREVAVFLGKSPSGTQTLLRNRVYLGELKVGQYLNEHAHAPIVDAELWLRAQHASPRYTKIDGPSLLTGHVLCAGCGYVMSRSGAREARVYACSRVHADGRCKAPAAITASRIDDYVQRIVSGELERLRSEARKGDAPLQAARQDAAAAVAERDAYLESVSAADIGAAAFRRGLLGRQARVDETEGELARLLAASEVADGPGDPVDVWEDMSIEQRNHALHGLLEGVIVRRAGGNGGGTGRRASLASRVRVVRGGAGIIVRHRPLVFPAPDADDVLRVQVAGGDLKLASKSA